jgi:hypothetical protein
MGEYKKYRLVQNIVELRQIRDTEVMHGLDENISISPKEKRSGYPYVTDMIARIPEDNCKEWLVPENEFKNNFEELKKWVDIKKQEPPVNTEVLVYFEKDDKIKVDKWVKHTKTIGKRYYNFVNKKWELFQEGKEYYYDWNYEPEPFKFRFGCFWIPLPEKPETKTQITKYYE